MSALLDAPCPKPVEIPVGASSPREIGLAKRGRFSVFGLDTRLTPPVDWTADPVDAHRYRQNLYKLRFLAPLLDAYARRGDVEALKVALALGLDFARAQPRHGPDTLGEAWTDKVVGDRAPFVGYLTRAAACEGLLDDAQAADLIELVHSHGEFLAENYRYVPDNHGLFADRGLHLIALYAPFLEEAGDWRDQARRRFEATLRGRLSEGMWLEHSSAYQFLAIRPVEQFIDLLGGDRELERVDAKMRAAAAWLVEPDEEITQFGDSNLEPVPSWGLRRAEKLEGMKAFFGAGMAFVRTPEPGGDDGYLAVTAGFHNLTHKHADELSFELYDDGRRIVSDTGLYAKDPGPKRDFVLSPQAHSTLVVDDRDWPIANSRRDYGSGLLAAGSGDGWYAIEAENPLVEPQGVHHTRLYLYHPGEVLVLVDTVRAKERHRYDRYLQLAPGIDAVVRGEDGAELEAEGLRGGVHDDNPGASRLSAVRGRRHPLAGFTSPDFRELVPRWTLRFSSREADAEHTLAIDLSGTGRQAQASHHGRRTVVALSHGDGTAAFPVRVTRRGEHLAITDPNE